MSDRHPATIHASAPRGAGTRIKAGDHQQERYEMGGWISKPSPGMIKYVRADDGDALIAALMRLGIVMVKIDSPSSDQIEGAVASAMAPYMDGMVGNSPKKLADALLVHIDADAVRGEFLNLPTLWGLRAIVRGEND